MSRRAYTDRDLLDTLDALAANRGRIRLTSVETGVPEKTISNWRDADEEWRVEQLQDASAKPRTKVARARARAERRRNAAIVGEVGDEKKEMVPPGRRSLYAPSRPLKNILTWLLEGTVEELSQRIPEMETDQLIRVFGITADKLIALEAHEEASRGPMPFFQIHPRKEQDHPCSACPYQPSQQ